MTLFVRMARRLAPLAIAISTVAAAPSVSAATIPAFQRTTNDGVFALTAEQAAHFGVPDAAYVGFLRPRSPNNATPLAAGDTFDVSAILASCRAGCDRVLSVRNGDSTELGYSGGFMDLLGTTTLTRSTQGALRGVAILFAGGNGAITFQGGASFAAGQSRGTLAHVVPAPAVVPVPAALPLLLAGLGSLAVAARRRRAA